MKIPFASIFLLSMMACASAPPAFDYDAAVKKAAVSHRTGFNRCYKKFGERKLTQVGFNLWTNDSGGVQSVEIDGGNTQDSNNDLNECLLTEIRKIKIPEAVGRESAAVTYRLYFSKR